MEFDVQTLVQLAALLIVTGVVAGVIAGLLGVGGGLVIVPALDALFAYIGIDPAVRLHLAVGTSLATIIATGLSSARSHHAKGAVDWGLIKRWGPAILVGTLLGAWIASLLHGATLSAIFATVALLAAGNMLLGKADWTLAKQMPRGPFLWALGLLVGGVSAMMGIGGGTLSVPIMTLHGRPVRQAVGTSAALGLVIGVPGALGFIVTGWGVEGLPPWSLGYVSVIGFLAIVPTTVLAAPWGAKLAHWLPPTLLKKGFACFLLVMAAKFYWSAITLVG